MNIKLIFLLSFHCFYALAQEPAKKHTISGYIKDRHTTEALTGANIFNRADMKGTAGNTYGFYSLTLNSGPVELVCSHVGYSPFILKFNLNCDTVINITLSASIQLKEVEVVGSRSERIQERTQMSSVNLSMNRIKSLPALMGETDIMKVLQLMPGIQSGGEGTSGLYVRGGGPDQNLILLDGVPVYNVSHLFGFFSLFNTDAINSMEIIKGGYPARYGGRVSSVLDIRMKEGNNQKYHGDLSVGIVSSKLTLEGPIWKDRTSFIVSARRTYLDLLLAPYIAIQNKQFRDSKYGFGYYFYDLTAKINHRFSDTDQLFMSFYTGDDKMFSEDIFYGENYESESESNMKWGNMMGVLRWNHIFTNKLFSNTTITYSRYRYLTGMDNWEKNVETSEEDHIGSTYNSGINDWSGKFSLDYIPSPDHFIRAGFQVIYHTFTPGVLAYKENVKTTSYGDQKYYGFEYSAYVEDEFRITERLKTNLGMHWSAFNIEDRLYNVWQPRISTRYLITEQLSAKVSYSRMAQYVHLLSNSNVGLPMDLWVPSTNLLKPQVSDQVAVGIAQNFKDGYEMNVEGYYKTMKNVLEYKEGASFLDVNSSWENKIVQGEGSSYGIEFFIQKKTGTLTGWVGYTLSWANRVFDEINNGKRFPYKYDRRHDISLVLTKRFGDKIELSGTWVFGSGNCITLPIGIYNLSNPATGYYSYMPNYPAYDEKYHTSYQKYFTGYRYSERNAFRMPPDHRLDLGISFIKKKKWGERRWVLGLYNAYGRKNPFYMDVSEDVKWGGNKDNTITAKKYVYKLHSLFPVIPSISYQFKF